MNKGVLTPLFWVGIIWMLYSALLGQWFGTPLDMFRAGMPEIVLYCPLLSSIVLHLVFWYILGNFCSLKQKSKTIRYKSCDLLEKKITFWKKKQFFEKKKTLFENLIEWVTPKLIAGKKYGTGETREKPQGGGVFISLFSWG